MCAKKAPRSPPAKRRKKTTARKRVAAIQPAGQTTVSPLAFDAIAAIAPPGTPVFAIDGLAPLSERVFTCIRSVVKVDEAVFGADATTRTLSFDTTPLPQSQDYREPWWAVGDQEKTGACVGWAVGDGLVRWYLTKKNRLPANDRLSVRYFWMAAKETDEFHEEPTTFLEDAGTSIRSALEVVQRFGCVDEATLPLNGRLFTGGQEAFFALAERLKITGTTPIRTDPDVLRTWLARQGPIAGRLLVDQSFFAARGTTPLDEYQPSAVSHRMGHAVVLAGYKDDGTFIIRNSWGEGWGDGGFAYATDRYLLRAFTEFFGIYF